jgi:hypothetical protein
MLRQRRATMSLLCFAPAKSGDQDVEVGDVFVEITEKTQFPGFRFSRRVEFGAWQRRKKAPGEKTALGGPRLGGL